MKAFFRVDASLEIGTGHVMRCLTLAHTLQDYGIENEFLCRKLDGNLINKIQNEGFKVHELDNAPKNNGKDGLEHSHWLKTTQQNDAKDCIKIIESKGVDWLIVDHYALDSQWEIALKPFTKKMLVIDDLADRAHDCNILLDQNFSRTHQEYEPLVTKECRLLLGTKYALLRPEFLNFREQSLKRRRNHEFKNLLINLGGVDLENNTAAILDFIKKSSLPNDININIVMGKHAPHLESVKNIASQLSQKVNIYIDIKNVAELMSAADLAIGASGSTTWERCCLGLPTIQIGVAKNQDFVGEALAKKCAIKLVHKLEEMIPVLEDSLNWAEEVACQASKICDGKGALRTFNHLRSNEFFCKNDIEFHNYIDLDLDDRATVLEMRNHEDIRKWMYNSNIISEKEHGSFIDSLEEDPSRSYFLVKQYQQIIGAVNFSKSPNSESVDFGIFSNPLVNIKGSGILLESAASEFAFNVLGAKKIKLEVLESNSKAISFYQRQGFTLVNSKKIKNKNIISMEKVIS